VRCVDYKNRNKKSDAIDFIAKKNMKSVILKSLLVKYRSATANLMKGGIASRNFVSFLWLLRSIFREQNNKVTFRHPDETSEP